MYGSHSKCFSGKSKNFDKYYSAGRWENGLAGWGGGGEFHLYSISSYFNGHSLFFFFLSLSCLPFAGLILVKNKICSKCIYSKSPTLWWGVLSLNAGVCGCVHFVGYVFCWSFEFPLARCMNMNFSQNDKTINRDSKQAFRILFCLDSVSHKYVSLNWV